MQILRGPRTEGWVPFHQGLERALYTLKKAPGLADIWLLAWAEGLLTCTALLLISTVSFPSCPRPTSPAPVSHVRLPFSLPLFLSFLFVKPSEQTLLCRIPFLSPCNPRVRSQGDTAVVLTVWWYCLLVVGMWKRKREVQLLSGLGTKDGPWEASPPVSWWPHGSPLAFFLSDFPHVSPSVLFLAKLSARLW